MSYRGICQSVALFPNAQDSIIPISSVGARPNFNFFDKRVRSKPPAFSPGELLAPARQATYSLPCILTRRPARTSTSCQATHSFPRSLAPRLARRITVQNKSPGQLQTSWIILQKDRAQLAQLTTKEALCSMGTPEKQPTRPAGAPGSSALAPRGTPQWPLPKTSPDHRTSILLADVDIEICRISCHVRFNFLLNVDGAVHRRKTGLSDMAPSCPESARRGQIGTISQGRASYFLRTMKHL